MSGFRNLALSAFVGWCSALAVLSAQGGGAAAAPGGADQQTRGKALYLDKCSSCHQENLKGSVETPPLTGDMFWTNWETYSANNLFQQIKSTMPEDSPGGLKAEEYADIVAYVLKFNEVPMTGELVADAEALKKVTIKKAQ